MVIGTGYFVGSVDMTDLNYRIIELCETLCDMQAKYRAGETIECVDSMLLNVINSIDFGHVQIGLLEQENGEICFSLDTISE